MYAVLMTGGKQYKVSEGDVIDVEKLDNKVGAKVTLSDVLMVGDKDDVKIGTPYVKGAKVTGEVLDQFKGKKIIVFKKRRRKNYRRKNGHRQLLTQLKIVSIAGK